VEYKVRDLVFKSRQVQNNNNKKDLRVWVRCVDMRSWQGRVGLRSAEGGWRACYSF